MRFIVPLGRKQRKTDREESYKCHYAMYLIIWYPSFFKAYLLIIQFFR